MLEYQIQQKFIDGTYKLKDHIFLYNISCNNFQYVNENLDQITNNELKNDIFLAACALSNNQIIDLVKNYVENNVLLYMNEDGNNCLNIACRYNSNLEVIKNIVENYKVNLNHVNKNGDNCLYIACAFNKNLEIVKYLFEKMDMSTTNEPSNFHPIYLKSACFNPNIDIIKYLINVKKYDPHYVDDKGLNCLHFAVQINSNLSVLKFLIEDCKIKIHHYVLIQGCSNNTNLDIIKYLIEELKLDIDYQLDNQYNCLMGACHKNTNLEIIIYLIEKCKIDANKFDKYHYNCLMYACVSNTNIDIIKYLVENVKIEVNNITLLIAIHKNPNFMISKYLIENTNLNFDFQLKIPFDKYQSIVPIIDNYNKFNKLYSYGLNYYTNDELKVIISKINPLMLNKDLMEKFNINPYNDTFSVFIKNVIGLKCKIPIYLDENLDNNINKNIKKIYNDFSKPEPLFVHNEVIYYGTKKIIYEFMCMFEGVVMNHLDSDELPILTAKASKEIINVYLQTCNDLTFNINDISKKDFTDFIMFIDQYPSKILQINLLEKKIVKYFDNNNILINDFWINICTKYQLKYLYLYFHQKTLFLNEE